MTQYAKNALLLVEKDGKFGFINRRGEVVIPVFYDNARDFSDGLALVMQGDKVFWIDESGETVLERPAEYKSYNFYNGCVCIIDDRGLYGLMDRQGNVVTPCQWENSLRLAFANGEITMVSRDGQKGFLNRQGELVTGRMHDVEAIRYGIDGDFLFLLEDGMLSIWSADGTRTY